MPFDQLRRPSLQKLIQKVAGAVSSPVKANRGSDQNSEGEKADRRSSSLFAKLRRPKSALHDIAKSPSPAPVIPPPSTPVASSPAEVRERPRKTGTDNMAEAEPDFSNLPLTERWVHKVWKVRKGAYEEAAKQFESSASEQDPVFRPFNQEPSLWKSAVADSNVACQADGIAAYCAFLKFGSRENCVRSRGQVLMPLCEKGLISTRPATKTSSLEALLLLIELDVAGPVLEEMLPVLSAKLPKVIAATLAALTAIFHSYGCKVVDPKPVLKILPKVFGHADKNVRAEATNLAAEFYRWLREAMKPMFWGDLKPSQQTDLEALFDKIKAEGPAKQERLLRSQQEALARAPPPGAEGDEHDEGEGAEEPAEIDAFDLAEPQEVLSSIPADFQEKLGSSKWKDRKEALDALYPLLNIPRIKDGDYGEVNRALAKCMKDANVAVVTQAANCIEVLAKGLRKAFGKYRGVIMPPIMERLKEKKATVSDALGAALDQVFLATSLTECLEDILAFLVHKNPQVKESTVKFLVRCLRETRDIPSKQELTGIVDAAKKLLSESSEGLRSSGAEVLGTIMKIIGERAMNPHMEGLDDIRKNKIKEFFDTAVVKAKEKPKPKAKAAPPPAARGPATKKPLGGVKKVAAGSKKPAPADSAPLSPQPTARPAPAASKLGAARTSGPVGLKAPQRRIGAPAGLPAARKAPAAPTPPPPFEEEDEPYEASPPPRPRPGLGRGGLAARSLTKPAAMAPPAAPVAVEPAPSNGLNAMERAELEELRDCNDRLIKQNEELRFDKSKMICELQELKDQHTLDVLSIKAKETQLVRARSDAEAAEQTNDRLRRELERLKRALAKAEAVATSSGRGSPKVGSPTRNDITSHRDGGGYGAGRGARISYASTTSAEERENGEAPPSYRNKMISPELRYASGSSGRASPAGGIRSTAMGDATGYGGGSSSAALGNGHATGNGNGNGVESWKRAAEVTSQLKARIEQMKAKQGFTRP